MQQAMADATPSDMELLSRARRGDSSATAELYTRHAGAARRLAATYPQAGEPDDLVHGAFERVLNAIDRGAGPDQAFRAYLFVTLRRLAAELAAKNQAEPIPDIPPPVEARVAAQGPNYDPDDRKIVLRAYQSLPDRQQAVLWHTAVEGRPPRELVPMLGASANAVAAMASRARERLREAYLQAHLQVAPPPECEPHRYRLGAFVRDSLSARDKASTEAHVADCDSCRGLVVELADVNQLLVRALHPLFLSSAAAGAAVVGGTLATGAAGGGTGGAAAVAGRALAASRRVAAKARSNPVTTGVVVVAVAALVAALVGLPIGNDRPQLASPAADPAPPAADEPAPDAPAPSPPSPAPVTEP
ncbi:MAG TPA: sigma-70 family RNA polymerase sigma factor, partial [Acidimicrobiales bacterium]